MSYPSPYQPPDPQAMNFNYYQPMADPLAPARRAGVMMFVMGGLALIGGLCCAGATTMIPGMLEQRPDAFQALTDRYGIGPDLIQPFFLVLSVLVLICGAVMFILGWFVRRGGKGSIVTSIILCGLVLLYFIANTAWGVGELRSAPAPQMVAGLCGTIVPLVAFALLLFWLIQAAKAAPMVRSMQQQYAMQWWQYQQQQQAFGQQHSQFMHPPRPSPQSPTQPPQPPEPPVPQ